MVTTDTILNTLREWVENKTPIAPSTWIDSAAKLNILKSMETDKLYFLQQEVAQATVLLIDDGNSVAMAKTRVTATDKYKEMKTQEAKIEMIEEQIRISKIQARMSQEEMRGY